LKNLVLSSFLFLLLGSCSFSLLNGYRHNGPYNGEQPPSWFRQDTGVSVFNTTIDMMKRHFSGLMVIKPLPDEAYRVVFITEVGLKIFDMEFNRREVIIHYFMQAMNKKALVKTLTRDIGLILMREHAAQTPVALHERSSGAPVLKYRENGRSFYYRLGETGMASGIIQSGPVLKKVKADFYSAGNNRVDSVSIAHYHVDLTIKLSRISNTSGHARE
jgi:hypothetical protein